MRRHSALIPSALRAATAVPAALQAQADLAITKSGAPPVLAGRNITYSIAVTNNGPNEAATLTLSDAIPPGTTFVSFAAPAGWTAATPAAGGTGTVTATNPILASAATASFTLVVNVDPAASGGTVIANSATVNSTTADPDPGNNVATTTNDVSVPQADLSITQSGAPHPVSAGHDITYSIAVTNNGPEEAASVSFSDAIPPGTTLVSFAAPAR